MYFIRLACLNFRRNIRYALPFCLTLALTLAVLITGGNIRHGGEAYLAETAASYTVTVEPVYFPQKRLSGSYESLDPQELTFAEIEYGAGSSYVAKTAFLYHESALSAYVWEIDFDPSLVSDVGYRITDRNELRYLQFFSAQNTSYLPDITLIAGEHICDASPQNGVLITENLATHRSLSVGDTISFPLAKEHSLYPSMLAEDFTVIGIVENDPLMDEFRIIMPTARRLLPYAAEDSPRAPRFILSRPDTAAQYIRDVIPVFAEKNFILQADDYAYKRDTYSIEMMLSLTDILLAVAVFVGALLLFAISVKSSLTRTRDIGILRLLGTKRRSVTVMFFTEKFLELFVGTVLGVLIGVVLCCVLPLVLASFPMLPISVAWEEGKWIVILCFACLFVSTVVFAVTMLRDIRKVVGG